MKTLNLFKITSIIVILTSLISCSKNKHDTLKNNSKIVSKTESNLTQANLEINFVTFDPKVNLDINVVATDIKDATYIWTITNSINNNVYIDETSKHTLHWGPKSGKTNFCVKVIDKNNNTETEICKTFSRTTKLI